MTTTQTAGGPKVSTGTNGTAKRTRTRKVLDAKAAGIRISEILDALPEGDRVKALNIAKALMDGAGAP